MALTCVHRICVKSVKTKITIVSFVVGCMCFYVLISSNIRRSSMYNVNSDDKQVVVFGKKFRRVASTVLESECSNGFTDEPRNCTTKFVFIQNKKLKAKFTEHDIGQVNAQTKPSMTQSDHNKTLQLPETTDYYTFEEYKLRARRDKDFMDRILGQDYILPHTKLVLESYLLDQTYSFAYNTTMKDQLKHNFSEFSDVLVFLHIQKTGGTHLNNRFLRELQVPFQCKRPCISHGPCDCLNSRNNMWFYTDAYTTRNCGLHADWTQMQKCIAGLVENIEQKKRQRRYFYFTQIRDPVERYLSEFHHQTTRGHWQDAILGCGNGVRANQHDVKPCFHGPNWTGVTLDQFMACTDNLATHRMTRMLADLTLAGCYTNFTNESTMKMRAPIWLESAMINLQSMEYIGLMEDEAASDKLFYKTYHLSFRRKLSPAKPRRAGAAIKLTVEQLFKVMRLVELDIHFYLFGRELFYKRLQNVSS